MRRVVPPASCLPCPKKQPSNNKMKLTKPATARMARSSQLILVLSRPIVIDECSIAGSFAK
jgi:hypothetical protein